MLMARSEVVDIICCKFKIREIEVPVPYEVVIPPPPPEIREVPVFIETPPQIIREPPEVEWFILVWLLYI